ncbi:class I SAM-dependent methyltransferase [Leeuwenhoekiella marinoflava]|uniref:class I SAM-dependent methyltransferase n=1 Tax=Leeuwenhoekiella marinoflava TaxID=988 RepID=UPI00300250DD
MKDEHTMNHESVKGIAAQLSCPSGPKGLEMAALMNRTNINMTMSAIVALELKNNDRLLELGHGNCGHLDKIITQAEGIKYHGLETSPLMVQEAKRISFSRLVEESTTFLHYDGENIPFESTFFDKVMTVNTLYFWKNPLQLLKEIYRILKPKGLFTVAFADKDFMLDLPFTKFGFTLYDKGLFTTLIADTDFNLLSIAAKREMVETKMGAFVERKYYIARLEKNVS